ncbi:hypothetical protein Y032_0122g1037 [Ancylostoma ceylanicum]|uniref:Uncharacterized protein n=1 Tax=Ancylostoma ceylanicum TaxID=53326 RepID=A0A016T8U8_9BILA|nr:hypothetical protein Y032_0122g1037 [Ancylostoma ceylanicum]
MTSTAVVQDNIRVVLDLIRDACAKSQLSKRCNLVAVSKTKPTDLITACYDVGQRHFGENYVQNPFSYTRRLAKAQTAILFTPKNPCLTEHRPSADPHRVTYALHTVGLDDGGLSAASKGTRRDRAARARIISGAANHWVLDSWFHFWLTSNVMNNYQKSPDLPLRRRFHHERRGRAACFLKRRKG